MEYSPPISTTIADQTPFTTSSNSEVTEATKDSRSMSSSLTSNVDGDMDHNKDYHQDHCAEEEDVTQQKPPASTVEDDPTVKSKEVKLSGDSYSSHECDDDGNINDVPKKEVTPSQSLQEEVNELRETLLQLSEQAKKDKSEQEELKRILYEDKTKRLDLYPVPMAQLRFLRRLDSDNSDDEDLDTIKNRAHKRRMEVAYKAELAYLEQDKKVRSQYRAEIAEWKEKEKTWMLAQQRLEDLLAEERAIPRLPTSPRGPSPSPSNSLLPQESASLEAEDKVEQGRLEELLQNYSRPKLNKVEQGGSDELLQNYSIPKLNRVEWKLFKAIPGVYRRDRDISKYHAIDVLVGDPDISFESMSRIFNLRRGKHSVRGLQHKVPLTQKKPPSSDQAPVAERIRIHSLHIIKILEKIHGESLISGKNETPILMIRPFRTLVYYGDQIQQKFQELESEFGEKEAATDIMNTVMTQSPELPEHDANDHPKNEEEDMIEREQKAQEEKDEYTRSAMAYKQMKVLVEFINTEILEKIESLTSGCCQKVAFADLWYLFKPGDEVVERSRRQAFRVLRVTNPVHKAIPPWRNFEASDSEAAPVTITCVYIDFDGKQLGPVTKEFVIKSFNGEKLITSLEVYPLSLVKENFGDDLSKQKSFRHRLIERGEMFLDVAKVKHMHYNGYTIDTGDEIDSQVVVDFAEAFSKADNNCQAATFEALIGASQEHPGDKQKCSAECCSEENIHYDHYVEKRRVDDYIAGLIPQDKITEPSVSIFPRNLADTRAPEKTIPESDLVIMSYRVFGYVLRSRKWAKLDSRFLSGVGTSRENLDRDNGDKSNEKTTEENAANAAGQTEKQTAFDQLVLPAGHKDMVKSLVAQHFRDKDSLTTQADQSDLVRGKGKGLIILLHGAPGVGKTTTAEGVAELFKKPLFQITCGDLGTTASDVEKALETHFSLANRWGCILLLDEADVFLSARSPHDFKRNGLVAVFLRVLEYYAGVLFLTTNRIGDFDEAFASRIHISLHYPQLDLESTRKVFELNLDLISRRFKEKSRDIMIEKDKIVKFAEDSWQKQKKMRWNGRQIRNACQTALALAEFDAQGGNHETIIDKHAKVKLTLKHLETVGVAYRDFIQYLEDVYDRDSELRAKYMRIRAREEKRKAKIVDPARVNGKKLVQKNGDDDEDDESEAGIGDMEVQNSDKGETGSKAGPSSKPDMTSSHAPVQAHGISPHGYYGPYPGMYPPPSAPAPQYGPPPGAGGQGGPGPNPWMGWPGYSYGQQPPPQV
ncbi:hypothetical protein GGI35DRAFT_454729 [Trichoderma velutinum]